MKQSTYLVYRIVNTVDGKSYVGMTSKTILARYYEHVGHSRNSFKKKLPGSIYEAMAPYSYEDIERIFKVECLGKFSSRREAHTEEIRQIRLLNTLVPHGYNSVSWANGVPPVTKASRKNLSKALMGHAVSEETRAKISRANRGRKLSEEHRLAISARLKGKEFSEEHKRAISAAKKGRSTGPRSEETKEKLSAALKGKNAGKSHPQSEETRRKISETNKKTWAERRRKPKRDTINIGRLPHDNLE
jgi:hypothetical protein